MATVAVGCRYGIPPVAAGLFVFGLQQRHLGCGDERAGRRRRAGAGPGDHVQVPRRVERRHGGGGRGRGRPWSPSACRSPCTCSRSRLRCGRRRPSRRAASSALPAPVPTGARHRDGTPARRSPLAAWTEPRTLLIGLFSAVHDLHGGDQQRLAQPRGHRRLPHGGRALGTLTFAVFLAAMTTGRLVRPRLHRPVRPGPDAAGLCRHRPG